MIRRGYDSWLIAIVLILLVFGLVMVQSASGPVATDRLGDAFHYVKRQSMGMSLGLFGCVALALLPQRFLRGQVWVIYGAVLVGLVLVFVPGVGRTVNGASRWLNAGPVSLQPSEFAKIAVVLTMAHFLDRNAGKLEDIKGGLLPALLIPAPMMLLIIMEPDFGTTAIIGATAFLCLYIAGLNQKWLVGLFGAGIVLGVPAMMHESYRVKRLASFWDPWADAAGDGYQVIQSWVALHSGGFFGRGLGESQAKHHFLPEPWTDFIASVIGEELGLFGLLVLIAVYGLFVWRGLTIARNASDLFGTVVATVITAGIGFQAFLNLGVVMGIVPNKGLVLPFVSYGASAITAHLLAVGLLLNVGAHGQRTQPARAALPRPQATRRGVVG